MQLELTSFPFISNITILRRIYGYGFEKPSMIQYKAIPVLSGKDDAQAQSGTGFAFLIGSPCNVDEL